MISMITNESLWSTTQTLIHRGVTMCSFKIIKFKFEKYVIIVFCDEKQIDKFPALGSIHWCFMRLIRP